MKTIESKEIFHSYMDGKIKGKLLSISYRRDSLISQFM